MARLTVDANEVSLLLSPVEKLFGFHGDIRVPVAGVTSASVVAHPWDWVRGARIPGTGLPGVIKLGTLRGDFGKDFVAMYGTRPVVLVELSGQTFQRLLVRTPTPERDVAAIMHAV